MIDRDRKPDGGHAGGGRLRVLLAVLGLAGTLAGCGSSAPIVSEVNNGQGYSDAQIMLILATEKNRYSDIYTDQIWDVEVNEDGTTFQTYLKGEVRSFLEELKTMNLLADEEELQLTRQEESVLEELTDDYYSGLTEEDRAYTGITRDEVYELYRDYYRADRLVEELTKDVDMEISDSEAKVITVQEICLSDRDMAEQVRGQAMMEGVDFLSLAKSVSEESEIEKSVGRSERGPEYEEAVFALAAGEISPVVADSGAYYIVKCINDYDETATLDRKQKLALMRKNQAFHQIYDPFAGENLVKLDEDIWEQVSLDQAEESTTTDFFTRYQDYTDF